MTKLNAKVSATKVCPGCSARYPPDALFCPNDGSPLTATPVGPRDSDAGLVAGGDGQDSYLGREISGHIEIRKLAGVGAMGRVYRAFQKGIDRDVAVKVLHRELSANQQLVARFHREAKVASRLQHPNVVQVHLAGQLPDGAMYIVMEYLDGLSLQSALAAAGGPLPLERALHIALQICDAVGEAHSQGVIHRDIKPENVMLIRRGDDPDFVKVLDFGIARLNWGEQSMATAAGLIFGTARYISPEGARGDPVGPEGDVYSVATMLYQMLAGRAPFDAEQAVALLVQQIHDPPQDLRGLPRASYVPEPIASVVMRNLSKKPSDRAPNGRAFARDLLDAAVASGMSAQEILTRRAMLGAARGSHPSAVKLPSMLRTQQLALESPETARAQPASTSLETPASEAMQAPSAPEGRTEVRTEIVGRRSAAPTSLVAGSTTTKWSPPSDFERRVAPTPPSKPPSSVDATLAGDVPPPAPALRGAALVALCFFVGVSGMGLVVWRLGVLARSETRAPVAERAKEVVVEPMHEPVVPALVEGPVAPLPPLDVEAPHSSAPRASAIAPGAASASAPPASPLRVAVEVSATRPSVGQPVDFAGHAVGSGGPGATPRRLDGARFRIVGPGILQGTELPAVDDGTGAYRTTFTFLQAGRFDVDFAAKADGAQVHSARTIAVGDVTAVIPPPPPAPAQTSSPATKWL